MNAVNTWRRTLDLGDIFHNEALSFEEKRDRMVERIRALDSLGLDSEMRAIADELATTGTPDDWDVPWDAFYDWADANRVWVRTFPKAGA